MENEKTVDTLRNDDHGLCVVMISIDDLHDFKGHPFKVLEDGAMFELAKSIEEKGVIVPLILRKNPYGEGYEIISGHRRKTACKWVGVTEIPAIVMELNDNDAIITMVDSNLQRENIKPSEKAFAYKMKLDAMKQQGKRTDLTFSQVEKKLGEENPTLKILEIICEKDKEGDLIIKNTGVVKCANYANEILAKQVGESRAQISRYIRLTYLVPKILDMVDEGKIAFTVGVELSHLKEDEQYELYAVMDMEQCTPSLSQAGRLKIKSQHGDLNINEIYQILQEEKPNQREQIKIRAESLDKYFPKSYTTKQKTDLIEKLVKQWYDKQQLRKSMSR